MSMSYQPNDSGPGHALPRDCGQTCWRRGELPGHASSLPQQTAISESSRLDPPNLRFASLRPIEIPNPFRNRRKQKFELVANRGSACTQPFED